jgi:cob(I)alamin adenosyltransferase
MFERTRVKRTRGEMMGNVYLYTGDGAGKTTAALGLALRSVGHKHKVIIIQFLKGRKNIGEWKIKKMLAPYYEIHQFGSPQFVDPKQLRQKDYELAHKGLEFARSVLKKRPHLLILDEINLAAAWGLIDKNEVLGLLENIPKKTDVVLTGRYAPKEFIDRADYVNEIMIVHYPEKMIAKKGIQY